MKKKYLFYIVLIILIQNIYSKKPAGLYNISADSTETVFLVDKSSQMFYIVQSLGPTELEVIDSIHASTGEKRGDKKREGDKKTPEGIYLLTNSIDGEDLPSLYGPLALVLNYPNQLDIIRGNGGSNIWIHGRNEKLKPRQTEGCISLENHSIIEVYKKYVDLDQTYIAIYDTLQHYSDEKYMKNVNQWKNWVGSWRKAWEEENFTRYKQYYSTDFRTDQDLTEYIQHKKDISSKTSWKKIHTSEVQVLSTEYETRIQFNQEYITPDLYSFGNKKLRLESNSSEWKIIKEEFTPLEKDPNWQKKVKDFALKWMSNADTANNLKDFYSDSINISNNSIVSWFGSHKDVKYNTKDFNVGMANDNIFTEYKFTGLTKDNILSGATKLYLIRNNRSWKIKSDTLLNKNVKSLGKFGKTFVKNWSTKWEKGKLDYYLDHYYRDNFSAYGVSYQDFAERKKRIEKIYSWKEIHVSGIQSKPRDDKIEITFTQKYNCPKFFSTGQKTLTLQANSNLEWKITRVDFSQESRQNIKSELLEFVRKWERSWENQDIEKYMKFYGEKFETEEFNREEWYNDKKNKFQRAESIKLNLGTIKVQSDKKYIWEVTFNQKYESDVYQDYGTKQLTIQGKPGNFKIINEEWWQ